MATTYVIQAKMSGCGSIHDIASAHYDRVIRFAPGCQYAVVLANFYGGKGYTTHMSLAAARAAGRRLRGYSYEIIDTAGNQVDY